MNRKKHEHMSVEEGQIVLKTEKQEKEEMERKEQLMQDKARDTAKTMVAEEMKKMLDHITTLKEEREHDKLTITGLMEKFERIQQEERTKEEMRLKETEAKRNQEIEKMEKQLRDLQQHVSTVNTEMEQVRVGEKQSGNALLKLQQEIELRKNEQERLVKEN